MKLTKAILLVAILASTAMAQNVEGFLTTWSQAQKEAKEQNKLIYAHFTTTWCGWCRKIEQDVYANEQGKKTLADFVAVTLDCTVEQGRQPAGETKINIELMGKFGGEGYPFLVIATPQGVAVNKISGYIPLEQFVKELADAKETYRELTEFEAYAGKADVKSFDYNAKAMVIYSKTGGMEKAAAAANEVLRLDPKNEKGRNATAYWVLLQGSPPTEDTAKTRELVDQIKKLDSRNQNGLMEKAYIVQAQRLFQACRDGDEAVMEKNVKAILALATEIVESGVELHESDEFYSMMIFANMQLKNPDGAIAAAQKALAVNPNSPQAPRLRAIVAQLTAQKEKSAGASAPASEPAGD